MVASTKNVQGPLWSGESTSLRRLSGGAIRFLASCIFCVGLRAQTFDTANTYSAGESEVILGKFLKQHKIPRESVVILTKTFNTDGKLEDKGPAGFTNHRGLSRKVS